MENYPVYRRWKYKGPTYCQAVTIDGDRLANSLILVSLYFQESSGTHYKED